MNITDWNDLRPGDMVRTKTKLLEVQGITAHNPNSGANVLKLCKIEAQGSTIGLPFTTADFAVYELATVPTGRLQGTTQMPARPIVKAPRLWRALRAAWAAFLLEWSK
jgi:hypothetical protein